MNDMEQFDGLMARLTDLINEEQEILANFHEMAPEEATDRLNELMGRLTVLKAAFDELQATMGGGPDDEAVSFES